MTAKQRLRQQVLEIQDRYDALNKRHERLIDAARTVINGTNYITQRPTPESLAKLDEVSAGFSPYEKDFDIDKVLTPERVALLVRMTEADIDHPWFHLKFKRKDPITFPRKFETSHELFYSRWFRMRWNPRPTMYSSISIRAWFGRLEIVLDPIAKDRWVKRDKNYKKVR